ncbi:MAG: hypothetical protein IPM39_14755 [Chloroflexi bacterium]|nr:hypothetical protein [Chloroflexota bacterium]
MDQKKNVLILETDRNFALRLAKALKELEPTRVSLTPAVREAALHLVQQPQDLAFIPLAADDQIVRSLRAVQPDLRLILLTPTPDVAVPDFYSGQVQAVLIKSLLSVDLPSVLKQASSQSFHSPGSEVAANQTGAPDTAVLLAALQQAQLGQLLQTVIFAQGTQVLAHWGTLNDTEVANVALHTGREWLQEGYKSRVQFLHLPPRAGEWLLYTICLDDAYLLTMVAAPEMPLAELRRQTGQLSSHLLNALQGITSFATAAETPATEDSADHKSYAIVWRPVVNLPPALHIPLRRALERLATVNGCRLRHTAVQPELVHLVVVCPPGRDSAWAAYLFKNGAEEIIQQEYGVAANLWETGYYAAESAEPLTDAELNIFLERDA